MTEPADRGDEPPVPGGASAPDEAPHSASDPLGLSVSAGVVTVDPEDLTAPVTALRVASFLSRDDLHFRWSSRSPGLLMLTWLVDLGLDDDFLVMMTIGVDGDEDEHGRAPGHLFGAVEAHSLWVRASMNLPFEVTRLPRLMSLANDWNRTRRWPTAIAMTWPDTPDLPGTARLVAEEHLPVRCGMSNTALLWWLRSIRSGTVECLVDLHRTALQGLDEFE